MDTIETGSAAERSNLTDPSTQESELLLSQMSLDLFCAVDEGPDRTRALRIYDLAPKYHHGKDTIVPLERAKSSSFTKQFQIKGQRFEVTVQAGIVKANDGKEYLQYPSGQEEMIEAALRKMAVSGSAFNFKGNLGVKFSIYKLQQELKAYGHEARYADIKRSIMVLRRSNLTIKDLSTGVTWEENFFPQLGIGGWQNRPGSEYHEWFISFHKLVTESIQNLQYRDMNYVDLMSIKGRLARYIFQRMVLLYTFASATAPYCPTRNQILDESGQGLDAPSGKLSEKMARAFAQLKDQGIIERWEVAERIRKGRSVENVVYRVFPSKRFVTEIVRANDANSYRKKTLGKAKVSEIIDMI